MKCEWCEQEIVLTADEPTVHYVPVYSGGDLVEEYALHDDCKPLWEEWRWEEWSRT